jgi:hypothetical protein
MDRRWPWKKKSTDKVVVEKTAASLDSADASNQVYYIIFHIRKVYFKNFVV